MSFAAACGRGAGSHHRRHRAPACVLPALALLAVLLLPAVGSPHALSPGYLELTELAGAPPDRVWDVLWKVPARGTRRLPLDVALPADCTGTEPARHYVGGGWVERWRVTCETALSGREVRIAGLSVASNDVLARVQRPDGAGQTERLTADRTGFTVTGRPSLTTIAATYTGLGIEHILLGVDHLLFVLGLLWIVRGPWMLVKTITAFTVAHSITLAAATLGWIGVSESPVNAAIALSIVFVAVEAVKLRRGEGGLTARWPWLVAFGFGLLHGLGFASALTALGLPHADVPAALLFFNVGVEVGQLGFVLLALALAWSQRILGARPGPAAQLAGIYAVGAIAGFWLIERVVAMVSA
jgi:hypothetical protein